MQPQKVNIFYVLKLLNDLSDEEHILKMSDIQKILKERFGVSADRRAVYGYINTLIYLGFDISIFDDNGKGYYLRKRKMDEAELKRVIFSVYMSPLCGRGDAAKTAEKLMDLQSMYKRRDRSRFIGEDVYNVRERLELTEKTDSLLYAAENGFETEIDYTVFDFVKGEFRKSVKQYRVIPQAVAVYGSVLYLVCSKQDCDGLHHYRIDRIRNVKLGKAAERSSLCEEKLREYTEEMIRGRGKERITIRCYECVLDDLMETFGHAVHILTYKNKCFTAIVETSCDLMQPWVMKNLKYCEVIAPVVFRERILDCIENNAYRMQAGE